MKDSDDLQEYLAGVTELSDMYDMTEKRIIQRDLNKLEKWVQVGPTKTSARCCSWFGEIPDMCRQEEQLYSGPVQEGLGGSW